MTEFQFPRIQVAGVSTLEEAFFCADVGVDALGFTLELPTGVHDGLTREKAAAIIRQLPDSVLAVVITYLATAREAASLMQDVGGGAVQFHGGIAEPDLIAFREACPSVKTIGCVTVVDQEAVADARPFRPPLWDAIILDSWDPRTGKKGATGLIHDWAISAKIVQEAHVPVILAGGLSPLNVGAAIRAVRPHGVDAHTGLENPDGSRNSDKIRAFAEAARAAFAKVARIRPGA